MKHILSISAGLIFIQIKLSAMDFVEIQKFMRFMTQEAVFFELQEQNKRNTCHTQETFAQKQVQPAEEQPAKKNGAKSTGKKK